MPVVKCDRKSPFPEASAMSGPTWLPPRTLDSPEQAGSQMSHSAGSAVYRAHNKMMGGMSDFRPKYGPYDPNGGGGVGGRYMASGSTGENNNNNCKQTLLNVKSTNSNLCFDFKGGPVHLSDHYYSPTCGPKDDRNWSPHVDGYELMVGVYSVALMEKVNIFFSFLFFLCFLRS